MAEVDDVRVQEIMNRSHPSIHADELATKARAFLRDQSVRVLPVIDDRTRLLGIISRGDMMSISSSVSPMRVKGIMSPVRFAATFDMDAIDAVREMMQIDEWYAPVVKSAQDNTYLGMFGLEHVIKPLYEKKALNLATKLSEVMSTNRLLVCSPEDEADDVWQRMKRQSFAACPVVEKGKPVGIVSQQNLIESGAFFPAFESKKGRFRASSTISSLMKTPVISLKGNNSVGDAVRLMLERNIGRVPIVDDKGLLIGIVDREDVLRALIEPR